MSEEAGVTAATAKDEAPPSPVSGEGAPKGRMRVFHAKSKRLTKNARTLRREDTDAEQRLWNELRDRRLNGHRFVRQFVVEPYIVDFACRAARLVLELDGSQHGESTYDERRTNRLNREGWSVLRFWNDEVLNERAAVCETILAALDGRMIGRCDGGGLIHGLRFAPGRPSPVRTAIAARPPSPETGEGRAPSPTTLPPAIDAAESQRP